MNTYEIVNKVIQEGDKTKIKRLISQNQNYNGHVAEVFLDKNGTKRKQVNALRKEHLFLPVGMVMRLLRATKVPKFINKVLRDQRLYDDVWIEKITGCMLGDRKCAQDIIGILKNNKGASHIVAAMAMATGDVNYLKSLIIDKEYMFEEQDIVDMIMATGDEEYIRDVIANKGKYGLSDDEAEILEVMFQDVKPGVESIVNKIFSDEGGLTGTDYATGMTIPEGDKKSNDGEERE